jgi:hypothetical protein
MYDKDYGQVILAAIHRLCTLPVLAPRRQRQYLMESNSTDSCIRSQKGKNLVRIAFLRHNTAQIIPLEE